MSDPCTHGRDRPDLPCPVCPPGTPLAEGIDFGKLLWLELRDRIIGVMAADGVSQVELAHRLMVHETMISRLLRGRKVPRVDTLLRLVAALGFRLRLERR
jgi:hypothetical protein